ncbi:MAG: hypothetical protein KAJ58_00275 [Candidatus Pacebacteria bacterium]|nr:hypothetical protein [Candidatus Paceibacterota bacterium]
MLYFLYGNNTQKAKKKLDSLLDLLFIKKPNASFFKLDLDNFNESKLEELLFGQGLFEQKYIIQMDFLFEDKDTQDFILNKLKEISESENIFLFKEKKINKPILKKIEKYATKVQEFSLKENGGRTFATRNGDFQINDFNIFDLATCFGNRNKKDLWVLYQKTKNKNISTEEVSGILFWQLRVMFQALNSKNAVEANLKPFVFNKAESYLKKYSEEELKKISSDLVTIYHDARRGLCEFDLALEKFILEI